MVTPRKPGETDMQYLARLADDTVGDRPRAIAEAEDSWLLQRDDGETDDEYAERCASLGCAPDGTIRLKRWRLVGDGE
jgi:hypothetical protein